MGKASNRRPAMRMEEHKGTPWSADGALLAGLLHQGHSFLQPMHLQEVQDDIAQPVDLTCCLHLHYQSRDFSPPSDASAATEHPGMGRCLTSTIVLYQVCAAMNGRGASLICIQA